MTRTERNEQRGIYKNKKVGKKNKKVTNNTFKKIVKGTVKNIVYFIVGTACITYRIIKYINDQVAKAFMKLPRLLKVATVYLLIASSIYGYINPRVEIKEVINEEIITFEWVKEEAHAEEPKQPTCEFGEIECKIYNKAMETGLTHEQAVLIISISKHETGNYTSNAFKNKNNIGGIMCSTGLRSYSTLDEGITAMVSLLKNRYFDKGLTTIESIGAVYCPVGAANDPTGVNQYWIPSVTRIYNTMIQK